MGKAVQALRFAVVLAVLQLTAGSAHACLFARDTKPQHWYEWASALFAGDVEKVEEDGKRALDVITVRVVETFKGPEGAVATLEVPRRVWTSCRLERPVVGARVLVALNASSDTLLVPLTADYAEQLRQRKAP